MSCNEERSPQELEVPRCRICVEHFDTDVSLAKKLPEPKHRLPISCCHCFKSICYVCVLKLREDKHLERFKTRKNPPAPAYLDCSYCGKKEGFVFKKLLIHREYCELLEHCQRVAQSQGGDNSVSVTAHDSAVSESVDDDGLKPAAVAVDRENPPVLAVADPEVVASARATEVIDVDAPIQVSRERARPSTGQSNCEMSPLQIPTMIHLNLSSSGTSSASSSDSRPTAKRPPKPDSEPHESVASIAVASIAVTKGPRRTSRRKAAQQTPQTRQSVTDDGLDSHPLTANGAYAVAVVSPSSDDNSSPTRASRGQNLEDPAEGAQQVQQQPFKKLSKQELARLKKANADKDKEEGEEVTASVQKYPIGTEFFKYFVGHGMYRGSVTAFDGKHYKAYYSEDRDWEDISEDELDTHIAKPSARSPPESSDITARARKRRKQSVLFPPRAAGLALANFTVQSIADRQWLDMLGTASSIYRIRTRQFGKHSSTATAKLGLENGHIVNWARTVQSHGAKAVVRGQSDSAAQEHALSERRFRKLKAGDIVVLVVADSEGGSREVYFGWVNHKRCGSWKPKQGRACGFLVFDENEAAPRRVMTRGVTWSRKGLAKPLREASGQDTRTWLRELHALNRHDVEDIGDTTHREFFSTAGFLKETEPLV